MGWKLAALRLLLFVVFTLIMSLLNYVIRGAIDVAGPIIGIPMFAGILWLAFFFERRDGYPALRRGRQLLARLRHNRPLQ